MSTNDDFKSGSSATSHPVSDKMALGIKWHFPHLEIALLKTYTFTSHHTPHPDAKADLEIYDETGALIMLGREFHSGKPAYWLPSRTTMIPERPGPTLAAAAASPTA
jgi:hypothetical protein